jgi:hypothetical protein
MMISPDFWQGLLDRAKDGLLRGHELDQAVAALKDPRSGADPYTLLHIIGHAMDNSYEGLVVSYLDCPEDPLLSRLALQILCNYWSKTSRYITYVKRFLAGVDWDDEGDVQQVAVSVVGEFLREKWDDELFRSLLDLALDEDDVRQMRIPAIEALARALGDYWIDMPPLTSGTTVETEWYRVTLDRAFKRFYSEK